MPTTSWTQHWRCSREYLSSAELGQGHWMVSPEFAMVNGCQWWLMVILCGTLGGSWNPTGSWNPPKVATCGQCNGQKWHMAGFLKEVVKWYLKQKIIYNRGQGLKCPNNVQSSNTLANGCLLWVGNSCFQGFQYQWSIVKGTKVCVARANSVICLYKNCLMYSWMFITVIYRVRLMEYNSKKKVYSCGPFPIMTQS